MSKLSPVTQEVGTCPVCQGTRRMPAGDKPSTKYCAGYDSATHSIPCTNCGGQYMFGSPIGLVKYRRDLHTPCQHEYEEVASARRNCYRVYLCKNCGDTYDVDSGD